MSDRIKVWIAVGALLLAGCAIPPANGRDVPERPAAGLLPDDCRAAGLYVVFGDEFPKQDGQPFWQNGFICVEHVNP